MHELMVGEVWGTSDGYAYVVLTNPEERQGLPRRGRERTVYVAWGDPFEITVVTARGFDDLERRIA